MEGGTKSRREEWISAEEGRDGGQEGDSEQRRQQYAVLFKSIRRNNLKAVAICLPPIGGRSVYPMIIARAAF